jgi:5-(carboxyamino)imidazole ribonucleotide synthase
MIGGGQLARMTHQAAIELGQSLRVLAANPDDSAALVCADVEIGHHTDLEALRRFADGCDVITFDHEHVPNEIIAQLEADGVVVHPRAAALAFAQDKGLMRQRLAELGLPVPAFALVRDLSEVVDFGAGHGWPLVLKTCRGGYDGRGVWILRSEAEAAEVLEQLSGAVVLVEQRVLLRRELAALVARSPFGQAAVWPIVETVQRDGICVEVIAPAPGLPGSRAVAAEQLALRIASTLDVTGVLAVELFEVPASTAYPEGLVINELAMRPHNSGHWTQDGSATSQFEQHLRAVLDYPLGSTASSWPLTVMANVIGAEPPPGIPELGMDERVHHLAARFPQAKVHLYGKGFRPGRKLGHVNVGARATADLAETRRVAQLAAHYLSAGVWADGYSVDIGSSHTVDAVVAVTPTAPMGPVPPSPPRERVEA